MGGVRVVSRVLRIGEGGRVGEVLVGRRAKTELGRAVGRLRPGTRGGIGRHRGRTGVQRLAAAAEIETSVGQHRGHSRGRERRERKERKKESEGESEFEL